MRHLNLTKKLFWIIAFCLIGANLLGTLHLYKQTQNLVIQRAQEKAKLLQTYFVSMRTIYHHQFLNSGLEINEKTVGFLPAHASLRISDLFSKKIEDGTEVRNVSDRPRNPANKADSFEEASMRFFVKNPQTPSQTQLITQEKNGLKRDYFFYSAPLFIEPYCISCHGKREEVLPFMREKYDTAYDYKVGDLRGLTSIKIPLDRLSEASMEIFYKNIILSWGITLFLLLFAYYAVRKLTIKDADAKVELEKEILKKTASLEAANAKQQHLFSVLRTLTDCNQVLISASSLEELITHTSNIIHKNPAFDGVKFILEEDGLLVVKGSLGLDEELDVLPLEAQTFYTNRELMLDTFDENLPFECLGKVKRHAIQALYFLPLIHDVNATKALGVMAICTKTVGGFSDEEKSILRELAGDIGFAINSYMQQKRIMQLSFYDPLTKLPNRSLLLNNISKLLAQSATQKSAAALLYIDIDNFKTINDLLGVQIGDRLLEEMSLRFMSLLHFHDELYHVGGDEFVIIMNKLSDEREKNILIAQNAAQKLQSIASQAFVIEGENVYTSLSIGITLLTDEALDPNELLNNAESAMKLSKKAGKNSIRFYDPLSQQLAIERSSMIQELRLALLREEFFMLYQKQYDENRGVIGVEALVRWQHPKQGRVSPALFIPLAEESGLIVALGNWIFYESLKELASWRGDERKKNWQISINVSPIQFNEPLFVESIDAMVRECGVSHSSIRLELTEGILINDITQLNSKVAALKSAGFSISIDDFGTGYSSLSYLQKLPIDELKIDQSFVKNLSIEAKNQTIIKTIIAMGAAFGLDVIAEGVESEEQFSILSELGCRRFQGYLLAKPLESKEL